MIRDFYPRWILNATLIGVCIGNTIEAAADLGGTAWVLNMFIPVPVPWLVAATGIAVVALQVRRPQFSGAESDEGARMVRHRSGVFDAAAPVAHHAHDEQSPDHGTQDVLGWATTGAIFLANFFM